MTGLVERIDTMEKVAELHLKGYKPSEIGRELSLSPAQTKHYVSQYKEYIANKVAHDPDFLDRIQDNTIEALERLDQLIKEGWETYETAKANDMINQQINLMKVVGGFEQQRANLLQLMGAKMDGGMMQRMQKAERVNEIVSRVIKEIVADCDRCKVQVQPRLAEAFAMMGKHEEAADMQPMSDDEPVEAEIIEEDDHDQEGMMADVIAYD